MDPGPQGCNTGGGRASHRPDQSNCLDDRALGLAGATLLPRARPGADPGARSEAVRLREAAHRPAPRGSVGLVAGGDESRRPYLDTLKGSMLTCKWKRETGGETPGTKLLRTTYHYWFHLGESQAVRQMLGHKGLPTFVGGFGKSVYRPEP